MRDMIQNPELQGRRAAPGKVAPIAKVVARVNRFRERLFLLAHFIMQPIGVKPR
jgi:hypothetical protein